MDPEDEQRYLELNFAVDRAVERELRYRELLELFEEGAAHAPEGVSWAWRLAAGLSANLMGDSTGAIERLQHARADLEETVQGDTAAASFLHSELARAHYHCGDHASGQEAAGRALQMARAANSLLAEAYAHHYMGLISTRRRDYDYARRHITAARDLFERMNQRIGRARVLDSLASLNMETGHFDTARQLLQESLAVKEELRDLRGQALTCGNLARLYTTLGDYPRALHYLDRERDLISRVGDERNATQVRVQRGELHLRHGNPDLAREELRGARDLARDRRDARLEAHAAFSLAEAEQQMGHGEAAHEALTAASTYFAAADDSVMYDRTRLRLALLDGQEPDSTAVQEPLERLRHSNAPEALAEALFKTATYSRERGETHQSTNLYAEALDVAEPAQAEQLAAQMRGRAESAEGRAWVDTMLAFKHQKDRLERAYDELRQAQALRNSLAQMIVHDLKNPLTAITPALQTIQLGILSPEETNECLQSAIDECHYLLSMIEDLNDMGKMQAEGKLDLSPAPLDLPFLLSDVARRLQARAREKGMKIVVEEVPPLPPLAGDWNKLRRVLENLVVNATKYGTPPEDSERPAEVRLAAVLEPVSEEGRASVRVEVRDFGVGIPAAEADRVFEPYYQAEAGRKRKAGVGLGLAFSRMVVEAHDGAIWTQPNPQGGSIFAFRLPVAE